jgi:hypothetical protein
MNLLPKRAHIPLLDFGNVFTRQNILQIFAIEQKNVLDEGFPHAVVYSSDFGQSVE